MSICECDNYYADYGLPLVYKALRLKARKDHKCDECFKPIRSGENYEFVRVLWRDKFEVIRTCERCLELRDFVVSRVPCSCWPHHNMIEDLIESAREYDHESPGLLFGALRRVVYIKRHRR